MRPDYIQILFFVALFGFLLDFTYTQTSFKYPYRLTATIILLFGTLMLFDLTAVGVMRLWAFSGVGLIGIGILGLPIEEFLFFLVAPYTAIVIWEAFHLANKRR